MHDSIRTTSGLEAPDIERAVAAALIVNAGEFHQVAELPPTTWTDATIRQAVAAMGELWHASGRYDLLAVGQRLARAGGRAKLAAELAAEAIPALDLVHHVEQLRQLAERRATADELTARLAAVTDTRQPWGDVARLLAQPVITTAGSGSPTMTTAAELVAAHPEQREPLFDGLLRRSEVGTIIAPSKCGKSWLTYGAALAFATGQDWLGTFATPTGGGRVVLIDNELAPETLGFRLRRVAKSLGVDLAQVGDRLRVVTFRGRRCALDDVEAAIRGAE